MATIKYVAFFRGINVGGNKKVPMSELKQTFEDLGFKEVQTLLNSGNVVFNSEGINLNAIKERIELSFEGKFGFKSSVVLRTIRDLQKLVDSKPFKDIPINNNTRLYITFLAIKPKRNTLSIPYFSPEKDFKILRVTDTEICSVLTLSKKKTTDAMAIIEQEFGKEVTTRNWNTIVKVVKT